jgi:hypothetical protein
MTTNGRTRVAIACQGGGSHTTFTAGVLQGALANLPADVDVVALSGTSGGAICAALAWEAVQVPGRGVYWDGLFSQNPCARVPIETHEILDRRNALSGNLSMEQELIFIEMLNRGIARGRINDADLRPMRVSRISMDRELNYRSKLDRRPEHLAELREFGRTKWRWFLKERDTRVEQSSNKGAA